MVLVYGNSQDASLHDGYGSQFGEQADREMLYFLGGGKRKRKIRSDTWQWDCRWQWEPPYAEQATDPGSKRRARGRRPAGGGEREERGGDAAAPMGFANLREGGSPPLFLWPSILVLPGPTSSDTCQPICCCESEPDALFLSFFLFSCEQRMAQKFEKILCAARFIFFTPQSTDSSRTFYTKLQRRFLF